MPLTTGVEAVVGETKVSDIGVNRLHEVPAGEEWRVPLLHSLLDIRAGDVQVQFDDHEALDDDLMDAALVNVCTN